MAISYNYETDFDLVDEKEYSDWIGRILISEKFQEGDLTYIFCDDDYLLNINERFLDHDTYTDIITFDYTEGKLISGDIFISVERVKENAITYREKFDDELRRVMVHGLLHLIGYGDKEEGDIEVMREKENEKIKLFHVER